MDLWVFDNDGTLYDDFGAGKKFMSILFDYVSHLLGISIEKAPNEVDRLKKKWQTDYSVLALMKEYGIDFSEMVQNTYLKINLDECGIVAPDLEKLKVLNSIKSRKVVFTNNPSAFARYVLSYVGLEKCFADVIGMEEMGFCEKPDVRAYQAVEQRNRGFNRIVFCDDSLKNLATARQFGWITVWRKPKAAKIEDGQGHLVISAFNELRNIV